MIDRFVYLAMNGAKQSMLKQEVVTQNLANVNTTAFKSQLDVFSAAPAFGDNAMPTRTFSVETVVGTDFTPGALMTTGRDLDAAIQTKGWFTVQTPDGSEAYTRNGNFQVGPDGMLRTNTGLAVMGEGGPLTIPPSSKINIGDDGTISVVQAGIANAVQIVGRLKLVNPEEKSIVRGADGLFRLQDGQPAQPDPAVKVTSRAVEGSNVNMIENLVSMISLSKQYDINMKLIQTADQNSRTASQLLNLSS